MLAAAIRAAGQFLHLAAGATALPASRIGAAQAYPSSTGKSARRSLIPRNC